MIRGKRLSNAICKKKLKILYNMSYIVVDVEALIAFRDKLGLKIKF